MTYHRLYTLGYSGWSLSQITAALDEHQAVLVDVRYKPWSRKTGMSKSSLQQRFRGRYVHLKDLGNVNYNNDEPIELLHAERGLIELEGYLRESPVIIMCVCPDLETCHRWVVADMASERLGVEVEHLEKPA